MALKVAEPVAGQKLSAPFLMAYGIKPHPLSDVQGCLLCLNPFHLIVGQRSPPNVKGGVDLWALLFENLLQYASYTLFLIDALTQERHVPIPGITYVAIKGTITVSQPVPDSCVLQTFPVTGTHNLTTGTTLAYDMSPNGGMGVQSQQSNIALTGRTTFRFWVPAQGTVAEGNYTLSVTGSDGSVASPETVFVWATIPNPCQPH